MTSLLQPHATGRNAAVGSFSQNGGKSLTSYHTINILPRFPWKNDIKSKCRRLVGINAADGPYTNLASIAVIYAVTLVSEGSRGLLMPSSWPYFHSVGGSKELLGVFVGILSLGRMLATIPLGHFSDRYSSEYIFYVTGLLQIAGHILYVCSPNVPSLILARFVVGLGSSTISVCRAYVARAVPKSDRTHHYAYLSAIQFIGFSILPGAGTLLSLLPETRFCGIALNEFTYPALVLALFCLATIVATFLFYEDPIPDPENVDTEHDTVDENEQATSNTSSYLPLAVCTITNVAFRGSIAELETVASPILMEQFDVTYGQTGLYMMIFGIIGLFVYILFKPLSNFYSDRVLIAIGLSATLLGSVPLAVPIISQNLTLFLYATSIGILWAFAYPVGQTGGLSLFSKTLRGIPPGKLLGVFSATGSAARIIFAVVAGALWGSFGREAVFGSISMLAIVAFGIVIYGWQNLLPGSNKQ